MQDTTHRAVVSLSWKFLSNGLMDLISGQLRLAAFLTRTISQFPLDNNSAMIQLMAGGGVALIGTTVVPLLSGLF